MGGWEINYSSMLPARQLAIKLETPLRLDLTSLERSKLRDYGLGAFSIKAEAATASELAFIHGQSTSRMSRFAARIRRNTGPLFGWTFIDDRRLDHPFERLESADGNVYLRGYWQSERYFAASAGTIQEEFQIRLAPTELNAELAQEIQDSNAVSVHVRRGDYISDPVVNTRHGACSLDYYIAAINQLRNRIAAPHFFVFSDDVDWAYHNLCFDGPATFVSHNGTERDYEDLRLMTLCKHHIIANSTFSWWGAWLNPSPGKIIYAPNRWFADPGRSSRDIIPDGWIQI